jgi:hypothetical protein
VDNVWHWIAFFINTRKIMNSIKFWYVTGWIVAAVLSAVGGAMFYQAFQQHLQNSAIINCLKVQGTDLKFCQQLANTQ